MRRVLRPALLVMVLVPLVGVMPDADSTATIGYFLHHKGGCTNGATPGPYGNLTDETGDDDGCGGIGTSGVVGGPLEMFKFSDPLPAAVPAGATVTVELFMAFQGVARMKMKSTVQSTNAAGDTVTVGVASSPSKIVTLPQELVKGGFSYFPMTFTTTEALAKGSPLTLVVSGTISPQWYFGYEETHNSRLTISF